MVKNVPYRRDATLKVYKRWVVRPLRWLAARWGFRWLDKHLISEQFSLKGVYPARYETLDRR